MEKKKKRVREHAKKHGLSYQAAYNLLEGNNDNLRNMKPRSAGDWWDLVDATNHPLTIADVKAMRKGERTELLVLHRNFMDSISHEASGEHAPMWPEEFLKDMSGVRGVYVHEEGMHGRLFGVWGDDPNGHPFNFDLQYNDKGDWYPLEDDGCLPELQDEAAWSDPSLAGKSWTEYPDDTRVGCRGSMLRWDLVDKFPKIFYPVEIGGFLGVMDKVIARGLRDVIDIDPERWEIKNDDGDWQCRVDNLTHDQKQSLEERIEDVKFWPRFREITQSEYSATHDEMESEKYAQVAGRMSESIVHLWESMGSVPMWLIWECANEHISDLAYEYKEGWPKVVSMVKIPSAMASDDDYQKFGLRELNAEFERIDGVIQKNKEHRPLECFGGDFIQERLGRILEFAKCFAVELEDEDEDVAPWGMERELAIKQSEKAASIIERTMESIRNLGEESNIGQEG